MRRPSIVKELREMQELTQIQLAVKADVDPKTLARAEDVDRMETVSIRNARKIAYALGVSVSVLVDPTLEDSKSEVLRVTRKHTAQGGS